MQLEGQKDLNIDLKSDNTPVTTASVNAPSAFSFMASSSSEPTTPVIATSATTAATITTATRTQQLLQ